jgi:23S rRNA pseudouridine2605 synthase
MTETTLIKALVAAGLGSRRAMAQAIKDGRVTLNGSAAESFSQVIDTATDRLTFDGKPVLPGKPEYVYLLLNKPVGVVTTTRDERGRPTVIDLLPPESRLAGLHPVGRLDQDSRGLILLTNDGDLTYRLTHPSFEKEKEYFVRLDKPLTGEAKLHFEQGIELTDGMTSPLKLHDERTQPAAYRVILHEGRKRQLRRMFQNLGYEVRDLARIRLGSLRLGDLEEGKSRPLTDSEILDLSKTAGR